MKFNVIEDVEDKKKFHLHCTVSPNPKWNSLYQIKSFGDFMLMEIRSNTIDYAISKKNKMQRRRRSSNPLRNIYYRKKRSRKRKRI